jgi:transcriptional regulator
MYQPAHGRYIEQHVETLHDFIREYPLGTLVCSDDRGIDASHVPFLLEASTPQKLTAHVPRGNDVWKRFDGRAVLVIFHGPNAYVSPSWYAAKTTTGKVVPTWNYAVVHAHATIRAISDRAWLRDHLEKLTATHESGFAHPWSLEDAPSDYIDALLGAIVGLELTVTRLEGKFKLGQNLSHEDQRCVIAGLESRGAFAAMLAAFVKKKLD